MKVVVCVKCVPEGRARLDPATARLDRDGAAEINPFDMHAVEEAVRIKEGTGDAEVVVVSMGPPTAAEALRAALALGADRAVLVSDPEAAGSDVLGTARVLAAALRRQEADLVLFGQQSADGTGALLWAAVAELLALPVVSQAVALAVGAGALRATRQTEDGDDVVEAALPAVVAVTDAVNEVRYASLKGVMAAKRKPLETVSLAELSVDAHDAGAAGAMTQVVAVRDPPGRGGVVRVEDPERAPGAIVELLVDRGLV